MVISLNFISLTENIIILGTSIKSNLNIIEFSTIVLDLVMILTFTCYNYILYS